MAGSEETGLELKWFKFRPPPPTWEHIVNELAASSTAASTNDATSSTSAPVQSVALPDSHDRPNTDHFVVPKVVLPPHLRIPGAGPLLQAVENSQVPIFPLRMHR